MILSIEEVKSLEDIPVCPTVKGTIVDVSKIERQGINGKGRFYAIIADGSGSISVTVYNEKHHEKFVKGLGITLVNVLCKKSFLGVTIKKEVAMCKPIIIPEAVMKEAPRLPGQAVDDILDALSSPEKSMISVKGRISKVYLPTNKNVGEDRIPYQDVMLKDISGKIKVAVWDKMVGTLDKGHLVELSKCRVKLFQAEKKLTTTSATTAVLFTSEDPQFDVSDDELNEDEPHQSMVDMPSGTIEAIFDVDPYLSCPKASCNNTKLTTVQEDADEVLKMLCKSCKGIFRGGASNSYMRATVLLVTASEQKKVTLFSPQIKKLFESRGLDSKIEWDKMKMITKFMDVIPIEIKYSLRNNTVSKLVCKRICQ